MPKAKKLLDNAKKLLVERISQQQDRRRARRTRPPVLGLGANMNCPRKLPSSTPAASTAI